MRFNLPLLFSLTGTASVQREWKTGIQRIQNFLGQAEKVDCKLIHTQLMQKSTVLLLEGISEQKRLTTITAVI